MPSVSAVVFPGMCYGVCNTAVFVWGFAFAWVAILFLLNCHQIWELSAFRQETSQEYKAAKEKKDSQEGAKEVQFHFVKSSFLLKLRPSSELFRYQVLARLMDRCRPGLAPSSVCRDLSAMPTTRAPTRDATGA